MIQQATLEQILHVSKHMRDVDRYELMNLRFNDSVDLLVLDAMRWPGGHWVCVDSSGEAVAVAGLAYLHPGVARAWAWGTDKFAANKLEITRSCKKALDNVLNEGSTHRIEAISWQGHNDAHDWLRCLGFEIEHILQKYGRDKADYYLFARGAA